MILNRSTNYSLSLVKRLPGLENDEYLRYLWQYFYNKSTFAEATKNLESENFKLEYFILASKQGWNFEDEDENSSPNF